MLPLPRDGEDAFSAWLQTSLAAQQVESLPRCWVSPSCLSCTWLPCRELSQAFSSVSSSWLPWGRTSLPSLVSICTTSGSSCSISHWVLLIGQVCTACFFGLKVESAGKGPPHFLLHPSEVEAGMDGTVRLAELLWVETLNTEPSEASGWQLVRVVGKGPMAGALGGIFLPLSSVPILKPGETHTFTEFAAAAAAGAAQPRPAGRGGGQHCDRCCAEPAPLGHLLEVSSPAS